MLDFLPQLDHASVFGVGHDFSIHSSIIDAAICFYAVRKEIERQKGMLSSATVTSIRKRKTLLPKNVASSIQDEQYRRLLLPLIFERPTVEGLNNYVIACLVLTKHHVKELTQCGLLKDFPRLFESVVGVVAAKPKTIDFIDTLVIEALNQVNDPLSERLKEIFESKRTERPTRLSHQGGEIQERPHDANIEQDEPLVLDPAVLEDLGDNINPRQPPPVDSPRHIVMQFTGAMTSRLETLLGLDSPLLQAIKSSLQWRWERAREESLSTLGHLTRTDCIIAMIPASQMHDFSIVIKVGYGAGSQISDYLRYGASITMETSQSE